MTLRLQDLKPFKAVEMPRVFWEIPAEVFAEGVQPRQVEAFDCIVELPNGFKAKCQGVVYQGENVGKHRYMGFIAEMWNDSAKMDSATPRCEPTAKNDSDGKATL